MKTITNIDKLKQEKKDILNNLSKLQSYEHIAKRNRFINECKHRLQEINKILE